MLPEKKPASPLFSSGPCAKRPGWTIDVLKNAPLGRSHRAAIGKSRLKEAIDKTHELLELPEGYRVGIVPGSDTGAVEMALWSLLGERGVDMLAWESFGSGWITDVTKQLKLDDVRKIEAPYGELPDLSQVDFARDVVFTWNGTTSGVKVPNGDWIAEDRGGLTICDATSAAFAMDLPWEKLDVTTFSWQKVMGGEGAHGILILSPRAVERLENYTPSWPLPKIFRLTKNGKLIEGIFKGATINTPSMLCVEDYLDTLNWGAEVGGLKGLIKRSEDNLAVLKSWVEKTDWVDFLASDPATLSNTSVCLKITADWFQNLSDDDKATAAKKLASLLDEQGVAYDIGAYRDAPAGLRIWAGSTIEAENLADLTPWLDWAHDEVRSIYK
ncbi:phosphoserine transaminase [Pseudemcibacter aquimaris]|uniref:phosphoserine transaminase n=1 Tax=Pseudemcibacter aquimaris TaxID=2857064 RepID=UPI0020131927|nr:phosphoserine transaminase [Pseudemcibacter aquimaris]MCC3862197.1 phosphoserine transaminase [Pseudemcibacter aquimaris]WDU58950.1 phosphoserine transaminase [Pseudemcibacter aquimaris]